MSVIVCCDFYSIILGDRLFFTTCTEGQSLVEALGPTCCPDAEHVIEALVTLSDTLAKWMKV